MFLSSSPLRKHDIARRVTSHKLLLFKFINCNDPTTLCSTPPSQIVPSRIFYRLKLFFYKNLPLPGINRTMQFLPCHVYTIYSAYVHTLFLIRYFLKYQNNVTSIVRPSAWLKRHLIFKVTRNVLYVYL